MKSYISLSKIQICCSESVSFDVLDNRYIQTKIVLKVLTETEEDYIEDIAAEFSANQDEDCVLKPIVEIGVSLATYKYVVYKKIGI